MEVAIALPDHRSNSNRVQETQFNHPVRKIIGIDHSRYQRNDDPERGHEDEPEAKVIDVSAIVLFDLLRFYVQRFLFHPIPLINNAKIKNKSNLPLPSKIFRYLGHSKAGHGFGLCCGSRCG